MNDIYSQFPNDTVIKKKINDIIQELLKIEGQDKILGEIIKNCMREIIDAVNKDKYQTEKENILNNLEKINLFTITPTLSEIMFEETEFPPVLTKLIELSLKDSDNNNNQNEIMLSNEIDILKKICDRINDPFNSIIVVLFYSLFRI